MSKDNEPKNIKRDSTPDWFTLGTRHIYHTEITGPNDAQYTGYGWTKDEADQEAGEKYRNGDSD